MVKVVVELLGPMAGWQVAMGVPSMGIVLTMVSKYSTCSINQCVITKLAYESQELEWVCEFDQNIIDDQEVGRGG